MKPVVTIQDVAEAAQVSRGTVSQVLNENSAVRITPETRARVAEVAARLGYAPDRSARALRTGKKMVVALCANRLHSQWAATIVDELHRLADLDGYALLICTSQKQVRSLQSVVDGVISLTPLGSTDDGIISVPRVYLDVDGEEAGDNVTFCLRPGSTEALEHLWNQGARRIVHITSALEDRPTDSRLTAYLEFAREKLDRDRIIPIAADTREMSYSAFIRYCRKEGPPEAAFCRNDEIALGVYQAAVVLGLRIPYDLAVVGCDGIDSFDYLTPTLTTISIPVREGCSRAWEFLKSRLAAPDLLPRIATCSAPLLVKGSSAGFHGVSTSTENL